MRPRYWITSNHWMRGSTSRSKANQSAGELALRFMLRIGRVSILTTFCAALLWGCTGEKPAPGAGVPTPAIGRFGIGPAQMEASVKPGDDFYKFVKGKGLSAFQMA